MRVQGTTAVVIGGGSGIGRGCALGLAGAGAKVVIGDIDPVSAASVADEITATGGQAVHQGVDGLDPTSITSLLQRGADSFGSVGIVSSNVGVLAARSLTEATEADWAWVFELNVLSHVRAVQAALPYLRANGEGHLVLTASMAALVAPAIPGIHIGLYTATKHAILGYAETLQAELSPEHIGVSVLCPGQVQSNLGATSLRHRPERHGGPIDVPDGPAQPGATQPEAIGRFVVQGIGEDRLHILTHPDAVGLVEQRHQRLVNDFTAYRR